MTTERRNHGEILGIPVARPGLMLFRTGRIRIFQALFALHLTLSPATLAAAPCDRLNERLEERVPHFNSTYLNTLKSGESDFKTMHGGGFTVTIPTPRKFEDGSTHLVPEKVLVTDSHVVDGSNVMLNGRPLPMEDVLIQKDYDIALIRHPDQNAPELATYSEQSGDLEVDPELAQAILSCQNPNRGPVLQLKDGESKQFLLPRSFGFQSNTVYPRPDVTDLSGPREGPGFKFVDDPSPNGRPRRALWNKGYLVEQIELKRGMSGLPLLTSYRQNGALTIGGVFQSPFLPSQESYFSNSGILAEMATAWKKGQRGTTGSQWRSHEGTLFLDHGNGTSELSIASPPAGAEHPPAGGERPPGGGERPPGGGERPPGGGERPPGGGERPPGGGKTQRGDKRAELSSMPIDEIYERTGTLPGNMYQGQPTIGLKLADGLVVWADRSMSQLMALGVKFEPVHFGENLGETLQKRLAIPPSSFRIENSLSKTRDGRNPSLTFDHGKVTVEFLPPGEKAPQGVVKFTLDEQGRLPGATRFAPFIRAKNQAGNKSYSVDIRGLYFVSGDAISDATPRDLQSLRFHSSLSLSIEARELQNKAVAHPKVYPIEFFAEDVMYPAPGVSPDCLPGEYLSIPLPVPGMGDLKRIFRVFEAPKYKQGAPQVFMNMSGKEIFEAKMKAWEEALSEPEEKIQDPKRILPQIDQWLGKPRPFCEHFRPGDRVSMTSDHRKEATLERENVEGQVISCDQSKAKFVTQFPGTGKTEERTMSRQDFEKSQGNGVRAILESMDNKTQLNGKPTQNYIEVLSAQDAPFTFADGSQVEAKAVTVRTMAPGVLESYEEKSRMHVLIGKGLPGTAQILKMEFIDRNGRPRPGSNGMTVTSYGR